VWLVVRDFKRDVVAGTLQAFALERLMTTTKNRVRLGCRAAEIQSRYVRNTGLDIYGHIKTIDNVV
jgi:hypothetical protein